MKLAAAMMGVLGACGSPTPAMMPDGGVAVDSGIDAPPACVDTDGDGVCDAVDDCPTVFDPGQVDLDGDGIGFVCDPRESVTIPIPAGMLDPGAPPFVFHGTTFAGVIQFGTFTDLGHAVIAANPYGESFARSDSNLPEDAWTQDPSLTPPALVTDNDEILFSSMGSTSRLDLAAHALQPLVTGAIRTTAGPLLAVQTVPTATGATLYDTTTGALVPVDTSAGVYQQKDGLFPLGDQVVAVSQTTPTTYSMSLLTEATDAYDSIATGLDDVGYLGRGITGLDFCTTDGASFNFVTTYAGAIVTAPIAITRCETTSVASAPQLASDARFILSQVGAIGSNLWSAWFVRDGQVTQVFDQQTTDQPSFSTVGTGVRAIALGPTDDVEYTQDTPLVWALNPDRSVVAIPQSLLHVRISASGNTIHIIGVQPTTNGFGDVVLIRYRVGDGIQQTTIQNNVVTSLEPHVFTTAEGAAFDGGYLVPSTSMTPIPAMTDTVAARGSTTVALVTDDGIETPDTVSAYDEIGGEPRFTSLATTPSNESFTLLDPTDGPPTDWFAFDDTSNQCQFGRIVYAGTTPTLTPIPCGTESLPVVQPGRTVAGEMVAMLTGDDGSAPTLWLLGATTARQVAHGVAQALVQPITLVYDTSQPTPPVVAWTGTDSLGGFICRAAHPEQCWTLNGTIEKIVQLGDPSDPTFAVVTMTAASTSVTVELLRTTGTGDRAQPLL
jgi:hypothetical protein